MNFSGNAFLGKMEIDSQAAASGFESAEKWNP
jgi:hypothetical protein